MKSIILASHGELSKYLLKSLEMIVGKVENVYTVSLQMEDDENSFLKKLDEVLSIVKTTNRLFILTDLLGGSPANFCLSKFIEEPKATIISGMNLPMLLTLYLQDDVDEEALIQISRESIQNLKNNKVQVEVEE